MRLDEQSGEENTSESTYTIWFSDFQTLWSETVTSQELFKRFSDKNPTLAMNDDDVIKNQLIAAIGTVANIKHPKVLHNSDDIELQLKYLIFDDVEVEFQWLCKKCGSSEFFEQMTKLLLREMGEMQAQKKQFVSELKKKDDEICQYKLEFGQTIDRKRFITERFEEEKFKLQNQTFDCEIVQFESVIGRLPKNVASTEAKVKEESCNTEGQPTQNATVVKHTSPRGKRPNPRRLPIKRAPLVRTGEWEYDDDSD